MAVIIRDATSADARACADIYNPYIADTTITFEIDPIDAAEMADRIAHKQEHHAFLIAERDGRVVGYAYAGEYRDRYAWQWATETSIYIDRDARSGGLGRLLYDALLERLEARGYRHAIAVITIPNDPSIAFHRALGFTDACQLDAVGWKFGAWHGVATMQRPIGDADGEPQPLC